MTTPLRRARRGGLVLLTVTALLVAACSGGDDDDASPAAPSDDGASMVDPAAPTTEADFTVRPGVEVATVTGAAAGHDLTLVDDEGEVGWSPW